MKSVIIFSAFLITISVHAQPGALDGSFGFSGKMVTSLGTGNHAVNCVVALQDDGKIVVAGTVIVNSEYDFFVLRYNSDGSADNSFGTAGQTITSFNSAKDSASAVAIQDDGKIIVAGFTDNGLRSSVALARYTTNGILDNTFGTAGKVAKTVGSGDGEAHAVAVQSNGKIVVSGYAISGGKQSFVVARFNANGTTDNTFGTGGIAITSIGSIEDQALAIAIQQDQKIIAGGYTVFYRNSLLGDDFRFALARYNTNGTPDSTFGSNGIKTNNVGYSVGGDAIKALAIQDDQKILAAGYCINQGANSRDFGLVRYETNGTLDATFGNNGIASIDFEYNTDHCRSLDITPSGKIVLGGYTYQDNQIEFDFALAQFNANGNPDVFFGNQGGVTTYINSPSLFDHDDYGHSVVVQPDYKIILAGLTEYAGQMNVALVRYFSSVPLVADAGTDTIICDTEQIQIGGFPSASGGVAPYTYSWSPSSDLSDAEDANPIASPSSTTTYTLTVSDLTGATTTSEVTITSTICSSTETLAIETGNIYPNPTDGILNIHIFSQDFCTCSISIVGVDGKVIFNNELRLSSGMNSISLDSEKLSPGLYYVVINSGGMRAGGRIVIE